ncbi:hypothetical protein NDU88_000678 [Pleurodeles waltl]|uniref:Uncharacterized protein n=1 Tax=Pleurodeles waltl TaxID=8319 RepID=A0AAV7LW81_PLEWA|nr:hypothetical protein NDU88_000678 [Pleurodeles waltl]
MTKAKGNGEYRSFHLPQPWDLEDEVMLPATVKQIQNYHTVKKKTPSDCRHFYCTCARGGVGNPSPRVAPHRGRFGLSACHSRADPPIERCLGRRGGGSCEECRHFRRVRGRRTEGRGTVQNVKLMSIARTTPVEAREPHFCATGDPGSAADTDDGA